MIRKTNECNIIISNKDVKTSLLPYLELITIVFEVCNKIDFLPPNLCWKIYSTNLQLVTSPSNPEIYSIDFKCEHRSIQHVAGSIDLPLFNSNLLTLEIIVRKLDFMVIVDTEHIPSSHSQAKASIQQLPNLDLEYCWLGDGFLCDEVHPIIDKYPFDPKAICPGSKGKALVVRVKWMWCYHLVLFYKRFFHKTAGCTAD